jgi:hypothetical protein
VGCKTEAIQGVSLDELNPPAAPARRAAPPPKPAPRPAPATRTPAPEPKPAPPRPAAKPAAAAPRRAAPPAAAPAPSRRPLLIGAGAAAAVLVIVAVVFFTRSTPSATTGASGPTKGGTPADPTPAVAAPDREAQAREAFGKVDALSRQTGASWDHLLAAVEKAKPACRGTAWEKKLEDLRARVIHEKETEDAARELAPLMDELRGAVSTDPEFKRYAELQAKFQNALEMAGKTGSSKMAEIRAIQTDYNGKYEKLAEPYYTEINEAAIQLAEEKRYDDALRKINTFPQPLRLSRAWVNLEKLKQDIERRRKDAPPKKK